jgi:threonine synthase
MPRYSHAEKKTHILWHGARVVEVRDREAARITARLVAKELGYRYVGIALEPAAVPGFKTVAYELQQEIKADSVFVPTGSGTNVVAIERGYKDLEGKLDKFPEIHCVQSAASAPIAGEFVEYKPISSTLAEGVIVPISERKDEAVKAVRVTGGSGWVVDDDEIYGAMSLLAENGIYTSPTGAVGLAGALKAQLKGRVVCIVTDSGLKSNLMLDSFKSRLISIGDEEPFERVLERLS